MSPALVRAHRARGLCEGCRRPADPGYIRCWFHRLAFYAYLRAHLAEHRGPASAPRSCSLCRRPDHNRGSHDLITTVEARLFQATGERPETVAALVAAVRAQGWDRYDP